jgi:hypothetical protein
MSRCGPFVAEAPLSLTGLKIASLSKSRWASPKIFRVLTEHLCLDAGSRPTSRKGKIRARIPSSNSFMRRTVSASNCLFPVSKLTTRQKFSNTSARRSKSDVTVLDRSISSSQTSGDCVAVARSNIALAFRNFRCDPVQKIEQSQSCPCTNETFGSALLSICLLMSSFRQRISKRQISRQSSVLKDKSVTLS